MSSFSDLLQKTVNLDYSDLVELAKDSLKVVIPVCEKIDRDNDGVIALTAILLAAVGADGKLTKLENKFLGDITGLSDSAIDKLTDMYSGKEEKLVDNLMDIINNEQKAALLALICAICAVDETISRDETAFIKKLVD